MRFEPNAGAFELREHIGHKAFERRAGRARDLTRRLSQGLRRAQAGHDILALGIDQEFTESSLSPVEGLRVNTTPVALRSPLLPNTMAWMVTAVPQSSGMLCRRR